MSHRFLQGTRDLTGRRLFLKWELRFRSESFEDFVNELTSRRVFPSSQRGGQFGEMFSAEDFAELTTITASRLPLALRARLRRFGWLRNFQLMPQPPLRGGEYSTFNISSIHSTV